MTTDATPAPETSAPEPANVPPWFHAVWLAPFALAFAPTAVWLWERWTISIWYNGHGIFMPVIVAYLVWDDYKREPDVRVNPSPLGFLFLATGFAILAFDTAIETNILAAIGLVVCLPGLSLLVLGATRTRRIIFPLIIAAFMLPVPAGAVSEFYLLLRTITSVGVEWVLSAIVGLPVLREGTMLFIPRMPVEVADACSGFSTLYAGLTTALILAHLTSSNTRRVTLVVASVVLALVCNIARVTILALMVEYFGAELLDTSLHEGSGMATFVVVIAALFWIAGKEALGPRDDEAKSTG